MSSSYTIRDGDTVRTERGAFVWSATHSTFRPEPLTRDIRYRFYLTTDNLIRCWTSDWRRTMEEIPSCGEFKMWISPIKRIELPIYTCD